MVTIMANIPGHMLTFSKLDLIDQYDFMDKTIYEVMTDSISTVAFVNCLSVQLSKDNIPDPNCRPLSLTGSVWDPAGGIKIYHRSRIARIYMTSREM
nr:UL36 [Gallid alphaherpesvirus 2]